MPCLRAPAGAAGHASKASAKGVSQAAGARMVSAFQDKDDEWDPDDALYSLSDDFEFDEEAEALLNKRPTISPSPYTHTHVEGDPTVG